MENDFRKIWLLAMITLAITMLICIAKAGAQKAISTKESDLIGTVTNLDAVIAGAGVPETVCVKVWKGRFSDGTKHTGTEHKTSQIRDVHMFKDTVAISGGVVKTWKDLCLDEKAGEWKLYQQSVEIWNAEKVKNFKADNTNRYLIDTTDLSKSQIDNIKAAGEKVQTLGNFRIKKEAK